MSNFFSLDGKVYQFGSFLLDIIKIGFLWTLFSLPIITIGASTTAMYFVCTKKGAGEDIYIFRNFFKSFKENFKQSTIIYSILLIVGLILWSNLHILGQLDMGFLGSVVHVALWFMILQLAVTATNVFAIISRFEMTTFGAIRYGWFMGYRHFFTLLINWITLAAIIIGSVFIPEILILTGGLYVYLSAKTFVKLFRKHSEEFDARLTNDRENYEALE